MGGVKIYRTAGLHREFFRIHFGQMQCARIGLQSFLRLLPFFLFNLNPERRFPSLFEPVYGSAPDIYGKNIANPVAMVWSGAMMLDFLASGPRTPDLGASASTTEMGKAIADEVRRRT